MYVGDYQLVHVGELSLEEYNLQSPGAQKRVARQGLVPSNKWKGYKSGSKVEQQAALQTMMDAFATGKEKIHIIAMEFVGYDLDFAEHVRAKYASWVPTNT
ncbi:hypothetical protein PAXRUDRAFT_831012 [Paxillus rubicundulus Ve08.2h10]|uniref:DUF6697 domain-containing protein n=1 Tax=Paxillus rubicundulus Ve08.2h10 TaxID=930991 RepID=A0A0D0DXQ9_9AGAM|nr:hypothetical protein PAXRUDRAFT_831012 [Paxillus rubicundulus Ve08.2h10]